MSKNLRDVLLMLMACILIAIMPLLMIRDSEFGGADGAAEEMIGEVAPDYVPWFESFLPELGSETESLIFCLQAALGASVLGYGFGYLVARKKFQNNGEEEKIEKEEK